MWMYSNYCAQLCFVSTYFSISYCTCHVLAMRTFHHHLGVNLGVGHSSHPRVALGWA